MLKPDGKIKEILSQCRDMKNISVFGLQKNSRRAVFCMAECGVLIEPDYVSAKEAYALVSAFDDAVFLPARSDSVGFSLERFGRLDFDRAKALSDVALGAKKIVTYVEAVMQLFPTAENVKAHTLRYNVGDSISPPEMTTALSLSGYKRVDQLSGVGQFAVRGDIIDISPVGYDEYCRIVLDFDEIESIKLLDKEEQITIRKTPSVTIAPFGEAYYTQAEKEQAIAIITKEHKALKAEARAHFSAIMSELELRLLSSRLDLPILLPYINSVSFSEFASLPIFLSDAKLCYDTAVLTKKEHENRVTVLVESGDALPSAQKQITSVENAFQGNLGSVTFHTGLSQNRFFPPDKVYELTDVILPDYSHDYELLSADIKNWTARGYEVNVFAGSEGGAEKLTEFFAKNGNFSKRDSGKLNVIDGIIPVSFILHENKQVVIGTTSVISKSSKRATSKRREAIPLPAVGDYVVHFTHGIGKCLSIEKLDFSGAMHDYVVIGYADGDKLYLPVENLDSLSKYIQSSDEPKLSKLGGGQFARVKERVKASIKEMTVNLVELYAKRVAGRGHVYEQEPALMADFISAFPHVDTEDQTIATEDALGDLALGKIMDRLICGDVGFGKTEVALRVAYRVIAERKQVAFLCPTTILALQHYKTAKKRMEEFGVRVAMLSRLTGADETKRTLDKLKKGEIDLVVGTHKLLGKEIKFRELGLLILDEEQRFGVAHKEHLKEMRHNVNVLTLSATPIPRTLHMSLSGMRDISMLSTPPFERLPVQTFVTEYSDGLLVDALTREYARGGQSYVVYNRVAGIDGFADRIRKLLPHLKVSVAHGRMSAELSEKTIESFASGETDVLVATTIIENGIDIPKANTMVVINSDGFGLSQMYQLRGRIGRSNRLASVYFTYDEGKQMTEVALQRLDAIMQCKELGSGFMLAMRDLEIRGAGDILGRQQHGHMEQVGYETYMRLLKEVMDEASGKEYIPEKDVIIRTDFNAFLPEKYISDTEWRLRQYANISRISSLGELNRLKNTMSDMYGNPPDEVINLLTVSLVRNLAQKIQADEVSLMKGKSSIIYYSVKDVPSDLIDKVEQVGGVVTLKNNLSLSFVGGKRLVRFICDYAGKVEKAD
ncbi:MAG: transcription-repair coupling factor [Clostridia bacterium]|nr:transcription-repair coupling factor [Clostridia bacterium]